MPANWSNKKGDPKPGPILDDIKRQNIGRRIPNTVNPDFTDYALCLLSCIDFSVPLPEEEQIEIVSDALTDSINANNIEPDLLLNNINRIYSRYINRPKSPFVLATTISMRYFDELKRCSISGSNITFSRYLPVRFKAKDLIESATCVIGGNFPTMYSAVRIRVNARSVYDAIDKSMDALDLLRGIWCLHLNRKTIMRISSGKTSPFNKIVPGPIYTLHHESGKLAYDNYLFDPFYTGSMNAVLYAKEWNSIKKTEQKVRKNLIASSVKDLIESAICRYVRALDSPDYQKSFLELWGLLETLTGTQGMTYDDTIRRASFLWADSEYHKERLRHLRKFRNRSVHAGVSSRQTMPLLCQVKGYVEQLIFVLLAKTRRLNGMEEFCQFLDSPQNARNLHRKVFLLKTAIKFRGG